MKRGGWGVGAAEEEEQQIAGDARGAGQEGEREGMRLAEEHGIAGRSGGEEVVGRRREGGVEEVEYGGGV